MQRAVLDEHQKSIPSDTAGRPIKLQYIHYRLKEVLGVLRIEIIREIWQHAGLLTYLSHHSTRQLGLEDKLPSV
jgi:hypothetical protein